MATKTRKKRVKRPPAQLLGPYDPVAGKAEAAAGLQAAAPPEESLTWGNPLHVVKGIAPG